jgi:hypothetical protein
VRTGTSAERHNNLDRFDSRRTNGAYMVKRLVMVHGPWEVTIHRARPMFPNPFRMSRFYKDL